MYIKDKFMEGMILIDTMHLVVKYPYMDVFQHWHKYVYRLDHRKLKEGVAVDDFVIRGGGSSYKISVWQHDARVFLTDYVDEKAGEGKGAGIWVQLGPKFLIQHIHELHKAVKDLLVAVGVEKDYPIKITRLDIAMDLFGVAMKDQELAAWQQGWVGRSEVKRVEFEDNQPQTIYVGSRQSAVYLRVYDKVAQALSEGDYFYWLDAWQGYAGQVTRVEWEVKPSTGNFADDLKDFSRFTPGFSVMELLNYLLDWGRLCIPNYSDSNRRRWQETPFWTRVRKLAEENSNGVNWPTSRFGKEFHGISDAYVKFVSGTLSGAMARFGEDAPNMVKLLEGLEYRGHSLGSIQRKAEKKALVISRL